MDQVVNNSSPTEEAVQEDVTSQESKETANEETVSQAPQAGNKTDPNLLLKSLREERELIKKLREENAQLEEELTTIKSSVPSDEEEPERVSRIESQLSEIRKKLDRQEILERHPQLKETWDDFEEFRADPENKGMNIRTSAKAFLVERGLLEKPRPGLEKTTGGPRTPSSTGMSVEDVKNLRQTNYKKYVQLLRSGQISV